MTRTLRWQLRAMTRTQHHGCEDQGRNHPKPPLLSLLGCPSPQLCSSRVNSSARLARIPVNTSCNNRPQTVVTSGLNVCQQKKTTSIKMLMEKHTKVMRKKVLIRHGHLERRYTVSITFLSHDENEIRERSSHSISCRAL